MIEQTEREKSEYVSRETFLLKVVVILCEVGYNKGKNYRE